MGEGSRYQRDRRATHLDRPDRTEFELLKRDVQWLKYGVCVSAASGVFTAAVNLGAPVMPAVVAGGIAGTLGLFR